MTRKRRVYDKDIKAAVMAALLSGQTIDRVAKEYNIPRGTVGRWSANINKEVGADSIMSDAEQEEIGELLLKYVQEGLATLIAQLYMFRDKKWLEQQDASEVAVLHGVQMDKIIRLVEAFNRHASTDKSAQD